MAASRLIGDYPVIGIRRIIDGRRGPLKVRESLEDQTMNMAKAAAKLFTENLKYSNGEPVKVVISDTSIGRVAEAAQCAAQFKKEGVDITLSVTPCWCYGSETMDSDPLTIKGVWGFNATERPGAVYLASVLATHAQKGLPAFGIYGHDLRAPVDFHRRDRLEGISDGDIRHVPLPGRGKGPVEGHFKARRIRKTFSKDTGRLVGSHRMRGRGTAADFIEFA